MKNRVFPVFILFLFSTSVLAQSDSTKVVLDSWKDPIPQLVGEIEKDRATIEQLRREIAMIRSTSNESETSNEAGYISQSALDDAKAELKESIDEIRGLVSDNPPYWLYSFLFLGITTAILFFVIKKRASSETASIIERLANERKELENEIVEVDGKLIELIEAQLKKIEGGEKDHKMVLTIVNETLKIEKFISRLDPDAPGTRTLSRGVKKIMRGVTNGGYELVEMVGKPYNDGMNVMADIIDDENLKPGERIITRVKKPQVNFDGKMIQAAEIEVSQGE